MPTLIITREPAKKHSIHAGDYELWVNNKFSQMIPNSSEPVTINLEVGTYQLEVKKRLWLRSPLFTTAFLSNNETIQLVTGSSVSSGSSMFAGMLGVGIAKSLTTSGWLKDEHNQVIFLIIFSLFSLAAILQWKFSKQIFLKPAKS